MVTITISPPPPPPGGTSKEHRTPMLFVFGDDFADNGNMESDPGLGIASRSWRYPFGISDTAHARKPSGRYSDGLVQSDFLAKIMGHRASPPAYLGDEWGDVMDPTGLNFAFGESGVMEVPPDGVPNLAKQVRLLGHLCRGPRPQGLGGARRLLRQRLRQFHQRRSCDDDGNADSDRHNKALRDRLAGEDDDKVMLLDVNSIITDLVAPREGSTLYDRQFTAPRLQACCNATDLGAGGYSLCDHPENYFFWDNVHPTQAGWRAVMQLLQGPIMAFLGISNLEHL
ncbi:unnamed protein product [Urochloa decumbens]|uniref:GDSL esterase/lipase n=1 Tax=Urochloa decumbens TaxID=240449 RepID=A0ABC9H433_9POAL